MIVIKVYSISFNGKVAYNKTNFDFLEIVPSSVENVIDNVSKFGEDVRLKVC